ncbi:MAG: hypothetical protein NUV61_04240 [Candidatus Azambacteria bacterium]|nr:hypothetical protein [Candidatus Azambacteria bacterium]
MPLILTDEQVKALEEAIVYVGLCKIAYARNNEIFKEVFATQRLESNTINIVKEILGVSLDDENSRNIFWDEVKRRYAILEEETHAKTLSEQHKGISKGIKKLFPFSREKAVTFGKGAAVGITLAGIGYLFFKGIALTGGKGKSKKKTGE